MVGPDQAASHRGVERHPQGGADAMQGGRGAGSPGACRGAGQDREGGLHVIQAQLSQQDPTEVRDQVLVDVLVVATQRGRPGPKAGGQPVLQPLRVVSSARCGSPGCGGRNAASACWASARVR
jgi:hypothetical protein